jgi:hypothetical protein
VIRDEKVVETNIKGLESKAIGLEASDKIFTIIFSSLYKNIAQSIVRELWTNAYDSHCEAGVKDKPFRCQLPTQLDPTFTVRDFGTGMDHDKVMNHYGTAGSSDRDKSNDYVGALGIGSKSPLSYTDSFTVKAFNGTDVRIYAVHLDEDNCPHISHTATFESEEPQGIEISFAAASHDSHDFELAARKVAFGFDTKPDVPGVEFDNPEPIFEADNVSVFKNSQVQYLATGSYRTTFFIKMGTVLYPYVPEQDYRVSRNGLFNSNLTVVIEAPLGAVNFIPSREELRMTDKTKSYISDTMHELEEGFFGIIADEVAKAKNSLQKHRAFTRWVGILTEFKLKQFIATLGLKEAINLHFLTVKGLPVDMKMLTAKGLEHTFTIRSREPALQVSWNSLSKTYFIIDNNPKRTVRAHRRCLLFAQEKNVELSAYSGNVYYLKSPKNKDVERIIRLLCLEPHQVVNINSLPDPGAPDTGSSGPDPDTLRGAWYPTDNDWSYTDRVSAMPVNYYWIHLDPLERRASIPFNHVTVPYGVFHFRQKYDHTLLRLLEQVCTLNGEDPAATRVYVLGKQAMAKLEPDESREFSLVLRQLLEKHKDDFYKIINHKPVSSVYHHRTVENILCSKQEPIVDPVVSKVHSRTYGSRIMDILRLTFTEPGTDADTPVDVTIENKYPLLFNHTPSQEDIQEYIDFINTKGASK